MKTKILSSILVAGLLLGIGATNALGIGGASGPVTYKSVGKIGAVKMNPYKMAPLTAVILNGGYDLSDAKVTVKAKGEKGIDISYDVSNSQLLTHGGIPVFGLYADYVNKVEVSYIKKR